MSFSKTWLWRVSQPLSTTRANQFHLLWLSGVREMMLGFLLYCYHGFRSFAKHVCKMRPKLVLCPRAETQLRCVQKCKARTWGC